MGGPCSTSPSCSCWLPEHSQPPSCPQAWTPPSALTIPSVELALPLPRTMPWLPTLLRRLPSEPSKLSSQQEPLELWEPVVTLDLAVSVGPLAVLLSGNKL